jgi:hypothetical protein
MAGGAGDALLIYSALIALSVWSVVEYLRVPRGRRRFLQSASLFLSAFLFRLFHKTSFGEAVSLAGWVLPAIVFVNFYNRAQVSKLERERRHEAERVRAQVSQRTRRARRNAKMRDGNFGVRAAVEWRKAAERGLQRSDDAPARASD